MECQKCGTPIRQGQEMELRGKTLCEDCYIDTLSPTRTCDPWAVHTARSFSGTNAVLTELQARILKVLEETGGAEPVALAERLGISPAELEREFATLRHMEKARAQMRNGTKIICLW